MIPRAFLISSPHPEELGLPANTAPGKPPVLRLDGLGRDEEALLADAAPRHGLRVTAATPCGPAAADSRSLVLSGDRTGLAILIREISARHPALAGALERPLASIGSPARRLRFASGDLILGGEAGAALMGILNVTPDSFSDGGRYMDPAAAVAHGCRLAEEGARIIDVGGESTRPGADPVGGSEEIARTIPVIDKLRSALPGRVHISIDTTKAEVARAALGAGAEIINDVSGLSADPSMRPIAARLGAHVIINHMRGEPRTMQSNPSYRHVIPEILAEIDQLVTEAVEAGTAEERIIIDPGIGFGKRPADNLAILRHMPSFVSTGRPVAVGVSRKSFLAGLGGDAGPATPERADATLAAETWAALGGAHIIRTHEPARAMHAVRMARAACGNI